VKARYLREKQITDVKPRVNDSPSWKAILKVRDLYLEGRRVLMKKGNICRVWKDPTFGGIPFVCEISSFI
jgi:hypothetical protein